MYSNEELERFYFTYQAEALPRGMSIQAYCSKNNVPYKLMERFSRSIQRKVVPVEIIGIPKTLEDNNSGQGIKEIKAPNKHHENKKATYSSRISVSVRLGNGVEVNQKGLDYQGLKTLVEKLEVLC